MTSRTCARPGCRRKLTPGHLACRDDWFLLPPPLRDRIIKAWHVKSRRPSPAAEAAYLAAFREALTTWASIVRETKGRTTDGGTP